MTKMRSHLQFCRLTFAHHLVNRSQNLDDSCRNCENENTQWHQYSASPCSSGLSCNSPLPYHGSLSMASWSSERSRSPFVFVSRCRPAHRMTCSRDGQFGSSFVNSVTVVEGSSASGFKHSPVSVLQLASPIISPECSISCGTSTCGCAATCLWSSARNRVAPSVAVSQNGNERIFMIQSKYSTIEDVSTCELV